MIKMDPDLVTELVKKNKRFNEREFDEYREIQVETGAVPLAEGSARVKIGDTEVVVGVKMEFGEPFDDKPDEGVLMVSAEFVPLAYEEFESGPPGKESVEVARVVDRAIRESKAIDTKKLCVEEGEKVWMVSVDIDVMNHDGNLIDASALAAMAALKEAKIPDLDEDGKPIYEEKGEKSLSLTKTPMSITFAKIGDKIMVDPIDLEERAMDSRLTVGVYEGGICSLQKGGPGGFTKEEFLEILDRAEKQAETLREKI